MSHMCVYVEERHVYLMRNGLLCRPEVESHRERDRQTDRQTDPDTESDRGRETETETKRQKSQDKTVLRQASGP